MSMLRGVCMFHLNRDGIMEEVFKRLYTRWSVCEHVSLKPSALFCLVPLLFTGSSLWAPMNNPVQKLRRLVERWARRWGAASVPKELPPKTEEKHSLPNALLVPTSHGGLFEPRRDPEYYAEDGEGVRLCVFIVEETLFRVSPCIPPPNFRFPTNDRHHIGPEMLST